jgi:hypothetical protein
VGSSGSAYASCGSRGISHSYANFATFRIVDVSVDTIPPTCASGPKRLGEVLPRSHATPRRAGRRAQSRARVCRTSGHFGDHGGDLLDALHLALESDEDARRRPTVSRSTTGTTRRAGLSTRRCRGAPNRRLADVEPASGLGVRHAVVLAQAAQDLRSAGSPGGSGRGCGRWTRVPGPRWMAASRPDLETVMAETARNPPLGADAYRPAATFCGMALPRVASRVASLQSQEIGAAAVRLVHRERSQMTWRPRIIDETVCLGDGFAQAAGRGMPKHRAMRMSRIARVREHPLSRRPPRRVLCRASVTANFPVSRLLATCSTSHPLKSVLAPVVKRWVLSAPASPTLRASKSTLGRARPCG